MSRKERLIEKLQDELRFEDSLTRLGPFEDFFPPTERSNELRELIEELEYKPQDHGGFSVEVDGY